MLSFFADGECLLRTVGQGPEDGWSNRHLVHPHCLGFHDTSTYTQDILTVCRFSDKSDRVGDL
jgi:hypothetical protein